MAFVEITEDLAAKIKEIQEEYTRALKVETELHLLYRAQGACEALDRVLGIPDKERLMAEVEDEDHYPDGGRSPSSLY